MRPVLRRRSFQARLSALVTIAVGLTVALAAVGAYLAVSHQLYGGINSQLRQDIDKAGGSGGINQNGVIAVYHSGAQIGVYSGTGAQLAVLNGFGEASPLDGGLQPTPAQLALTRRAGSSLITDGTLQGQPYRFEALSIPAQLYGQPIVAVLLIGQPLGPTLATLAHLRLALILIAAFGIAIAICLGMAVGQATIAPVKKLTAAAEHVAETQDLEATIDDEGDDELGRLAGAFNMMLAALAASRQQQAQLVSDAGHELRTPLTSLRTNIEFLLRARNMPEADREELLHDVQDQLEELTALVGDIVDTARQDERQDREYVDVPLDRVLERAVDRARRRAPSLQFDVALAPGLVRAQPALLERALLNVLDNAAKWSPPGGTVVLRAGVDGGQWLVSVRDEGPGIAPEDLPKVFDRFYRASTARSMPGSGLGLAIVLKVVTEHHGSVEVSSPPGEGTEVVVRLPTVEDVAPFDGDPLWAPPPPPPPVPVPVPSTTGAPAAGGGPAA